MQKKLALITGATGGIGGAVSKRFEEAGYDVLKPSSKELNLSDESSIQQWCVNNSNLRPSTIVLCAGINLPESFENQTDSEFRMINQVNLFANIYILRNFAPSMSPDNTPRIVFISSLYASKSRKGRSAYSVSKAGLDALMRSLALEFAEKRILVNSVAPGFVETELTYANNDPNNIKK